MGRRNVNAFQLIVVLLLYSFRPTLSLELLPEPLPDKLYPSRSYVTVSGTEIGGLMAQMFHISHSKLIKGCAVYSSTFYRCGLGNGNPADFKLLCMKDTPIPIEEQTSVDHAVGDLSSYDTNHLIDPLSDLRKSHVYVYCGLQNAEFTTDQQLNVVELYEHYLESPYLIRTRVQNTAEPLRVIDIEDNSPRCPSASEPDGTVSPNCTNLSAPAEALEFLLGQYVHFVNPFYDPSYHYIRLEPLKSFNQLEFTHELESTGLDEIGYYYVPRRCAYRPRRPCFLHIYFHGCNQGREFQGTTHVVKSNYLEVAEVNGIIMLFPQVLSSEINPEGCWDFAGWTGSSYATKTGPQIEAIWRMVERLLYLRPENPQPYSPPSYSSSPAYSPPPYSSTPSYPTSPPPISSYFRAKSSSGPSPSSPSHNKDTSPSYSFPVKPEYHPAVDATTGRKPTVYPAGPLNPSGGYAYGGHGYSNSYNGVSNSHYTAPPSPPTHKSVRRVKRLHGFGDNEIPSM